MGVTGGQRSPLLPSQPAGSNIYLATPFCSCKHNMCSRFVARHTARPVNTAAITLQANSARLALAFAVSAVLNTIGRLASFVRCSKVDSGSGGPPGKKGMSKASALLPAKKMSCVYPYVRMRKRVICNMHGISGLHDR